MYNNCTSVYSVEFTLNALYDLENDLGAVFSSVFGADTSDLNKSIVMRNNKDVLANFVVSMTGTLKRSRTSVRSAAEIRPDRESEESDQTLG